MPGDIKPPSPFRSASRNETKLHRHEHQLRERPGTHLLHDVTAVDLGRLLTDPEALSDDFVRQAGGDETEDLVLTMRECGCAQARFPLFLHLKKSGFAPKETFLDRFKEFTIFDRLREKIECTGLHCIHAGRKITVSGEKDHGQRATFERELLLHFQPVGPRHVHIEDDTASCKRGDCIQKLGR